MSPGELLGAFNSWTRSTAQIPPDRFQNLLDEFVLEKDWISLFPISAYKSNL
jgi:hypothetical protein